MSEGRVKNTELSAIGAAIRAKLGSATFYKPGEMAAAIASIPTGGEAVIESKSISQNGTYTAPSGVDGFSPVVVDVPNSYVQADEGKVVSNGALVAQGSDTVTQNGTVDTTLISSLTVNVAGGSSTFNGTLIYELSGSQGGIWVSTGHDVTNDIGYVVCYYVDGELEKIITVDKTAISEPVNNDYVNIAVVVSSSQGNPLSGSQFNMKITNQILQVSFGNVSSRYYAKVYSAGNALNYFSQFYQ